MCRVRGICANKKNEEVRDREWWLQRLCQDSGRGSEERGSLQDGGHVPVHIFRGYFSG